jgi:protease I
MAQALQLYKIAILAADGVERVELEQPRGALHGAGARTEILSIHPGEIQAKQWDLEPAGTLPVDRLVADATTADYDALLLPGGTVSPDRLRANRDAVNFVHEFAASGKPIAAICHGPVMLIEAGAVRGLHLTDGQFTTSRSPADLPAFCAAIVEQFAKLGSTTSA